MFSFGLITDLQYADADADVFDMPNISYSSNRQYRKSPAKLEQAIAEFNKHRLEMVFHLGDFIDRSLDDFAAINAPLHDLNMPFMHLLGNHDLQDSRATPEGMVELYGMPNRYYSQTVADFRLVALDSNEIGVIGRSPDSPEGRAGTELLSGLRAAGAVQANPWNGGLGAEQRSWLEAEITDAKSEDQRVVILVHHPIFPLSSHAMLDSEATLDIIDRFDNVVAVFSGHNHPGDYRVRSGVSHMTLPGVVEDDDNSFAILDVYPDRLEIKGYGRQRSLVIDL